MGNKNNFIEINGKRYDAITGKHLSGVSAHAVHSAPAVPKGNNLDGFRRVSKATAASTTILKPLPKRPVKTVAHPVQKTHKAHEPARHIDAHQPEPAKTLMRSVVKKPVIVAPSVIKAQTRTDILAKVPEHIIVPKVSQQNISPSRLKKAARMVKSPQIARYAPSTTVKAIAQPAHSLHSVQAGQQPAHHTVSSPIDAIQSSLSKASHPGKAPQKQDLFSEALKNARSHEAVEHAQAKRSGKRRRVSGVLSIAICLLIVAGFITYTNTSAISMRMASNKAGFSAKLPAYIATGYDLGNLNYSHGNVTVNYTDHKDASRSYDITQRASNWDSQALLSNFVGAANTSYQTYEQAGRTIYILGNNTATWVDSGIWYTVNANDSLSTYQILHLAGSL